MLYKKRCDFLNIDFGKKIEKKKWEKFLTDERMFNIHYAFRLLKKDDDQLDLKMMTYIERNYNVLNCKSLFTKIKLIKHIEHVLELNTLDIDTRRDFMKFCNKVAIDDDTINMIKKVFRIRKKVIDDSFEFWYYQIIQMYKNVLDSVFFVNRHSNIKGVQYMIYNTNLNIINEHDSLFNKTKVLEI